MSTGYVLDDLQVESTGDNAMGAIEDFSSDAISIERNGHVGTLWLDRPEKRNAMNRELWTGIIAGLEALEADGETRVILLAGKGKSFCVGLDLAMLTAGASESGLGGGGKKSGATAHLEQLRRTQEIQSAVTALSKTKVPVIAAIHGHCIGGGVDMITACDIRLAAEDAIFSIRETKIGIVADVGTLQRLPKIVTAGHVAELAYTGKDIGAKRAEEIGLLNSVHADFDATYQAAFDIALEIAANSPLTVQGTRFVLEQGENLTTDQSLLLNGIWTMMTSLQSNDLREAMAAFLEKRPADYDGT
ncbi:MAG: enoyl-CoA hydratase-related protein [Myxococcota bacterium]